MPLKDKDCIKENNDRLYIVCPTCGYKLLKAGDGSTIEIYCPKCGAKMMIEIQDGKIIIQKILSDKI